MQNKSFNHIIIQEAHPQSLIELETIVSSPQDFEIVPNPTKRDMKKLEVKYLYCPDCELQEINRNGRTNKGTQRFMCKECDYQFVAQFDAVFPQNKRRAIFEAEFLENIKPTGFDKVGTGKKKYWSRARLETLQVLETQEMRIKANRMIKSSPIRCDKDYKVLLEFLVHEAYGRVVN